MENNILKTGGPGLDKDHGLSSSKRCGLEKLGQNK